MVQGLGLSGLGHPCIPGLGIGIEGFGVRVLSASSSGGADWEPRSGRS